jgi:hypothetical protein
MKKGRPQSGVSVFAFLEKNLCGPLCNSESSVVIFPLSL